LRNSVKQFDDSFTPTASHNKVSVFEAKRNTVSDEVEDSESLTSDSEEEPDRFELRQSYRPSAKVIDYEDINL